MVMSPIRVAGRASGQAVQALEGLFLVPVQVAHRVEHDCPALPPVGMDPQHRLLGHRAAGQEGAAGFPSNPATSASSSATTPPSP